MQAGGIILYPTDTIWGIGCDATNEKAVQKVYELKKRTDNKAMLVLTDSSAKLSMYVSDMPDIAWDLIEVADKPEKNAAASCAVIWTASAASCSGTEITLAAFSGKRDIRRSSSRLLPPASSSIKILTIPFSRACASTRETFAREMPKRSAMSDWVQSWL